MSALLKPAHHTSRPRPNCRTGEPDRALSALMTEMPQEVAVKALANGQPFAGAAFNVTLATSKNGLSVF